MTVWRSVDGGLWCILGSDRGTPARAFRKGAAAEDHLGGHAPEGRRREGWKRGRERGRGGARGWGGWERLGATAGGGVLDRVKLHRVGRVGGVCQAEGVLPSEAFFPLADLTAEGEKDAQLADAFVVPLALAAFFRAG